MFFFIQVFDIYYTYILGLGIIITLISSGASNFWNHTNDIEEDIRNKKETFLTNGTISQNEAVIISIVLYSISLILILYVKHVNWYGLNNMKNKTLLQEMREVLRRFGYAYSTEKTYCDWVTRFVKFHQLKEKNELLQSAEQKVENFLTHLAVNKNVAPSTQNQALNALFFCIKKV